MSAHLAHHGRVSNAWTSSTSAQGGTPAVPAYASHAEVGEGLCHSSFFIGWLTGLSPAAMSDTPEDAVAAVATPADEHEVPIIVKKKPIKKPERPDDVELKTKTQALQDSSKLLCHAPDVLVNMLCRTSLPAPPHHRGENESIPAPRLPCSRETQGSD
jgi:hypothetical protein